MLSDIFCPRHIKLNLESTTLTGVFEELVETITRANPELDDRKLFEAVILRESKMNTIVRPGIAMPHGYCSNVNGIIGAIGVSPAGIEYDELNQPVHLFFMLLLDEVSREQHLQVFNRLLELFNSTAFSKIRNMKTPQDVHDLISRF